MLTNHKHVGAHFLHSVLTGKGILSISEVEALKAKLQNHKTIFKNLSRGLKTGADLGFSRGGGGGGLGRPN